METFFLYNIQTLIINLIRRRKKSLTYLYYYFHYLIPDGEKPASSGEKKSKPTKKRFEIRKWSAVAFWSWGKLFNILSLKKKKKKSIYPKFSLFGFYLSMRYHDMN